jgi:hypothetical protein
LSAIVLGNALCSSGVAQATGDFSYDQATVYNKLSCNNPGMPNALNFPYIFADSKACKHRTRNATATLDGISGLMSLTNNDAVLAHRTDHAADHAE